MSTPQRYVHRNTSTFLHNKPFVKLDEKQNPLDRLAVLGASISPGAYYLLMAGVTRMPHAARWSLGKRPYQIAADSYAFLLFP